MKTILKFVWFAVVFVLIGLSSVYPQNNESEDEVFPDDLFTEPELKIHRAKSFFSAKPFFKNNRIHVFVGKSAMISDTKNRFKNSFAATDDITISQNSWLAGFEFNILKSTSLTAAFMPPEKYRSKNIEAPNANYEFVTAYKLVYGPLIRLGITQKILQASRFRVYGGGGIDYRKFSMNGKFVSKPANDNSKITLVNEKQNFRDIGKNLSVNIDFYIFKNVSLVAKYDFHFGKSKLIKDQSIIRSWDQFNISYTMATIPGFKTKSSYPSFSIGTQIHLF